MNIEVPIKDEGVSAVLITFEAEDSEGNLTGDKRGFRYVLSSPVSGSSEYDEFIISFTGKEEVGK